MDAINEFITPAELCKKLHICRQTLAKHSNSGKIPKYKLGRKSFFKESEVISALTKIEPVKIFNNVTSPDSATRHIYKKK